MLIIILIAILTLLSTFLGGLFALKFRDRLHLILGFSAGAVIGVGFFHLLPEAFELNANKFSTSTISLLIGAGFLAYMIADRYLDFHSHNHEHDEHAEDAHEHTDGHAQTQAPASASAKGIISASSLVLHSLVDGLAIGMAFQINYTIGISVALAVLLHDFSDGINTVSVILRNGGAKTRALFWLILDSIVPAIGVIIGYNLNFGEEAFGILIAVFAGLFMYIGASDLLPESHHRHPTLWTTASTILGIALIVISRFFVSI